MRIWTPLLHAVAVVPFLVAPVACGTEGCFEQCDAAESLDCSSESVLACRAACEAEESVAQEAGCDALLTDQRDACISALESCDDLPLVPNNTADCARAQADLQTCLTDTSTDT